LAALGVGIYSDTQAVAKAWQLSATFKPNMSGTQVKEHVERWRAAVGRA